jgi:hypothetical protein
MAFAILTAIGAGTPAAAQASFSADGNKIVVKTESLGKTGIIEVQAICNINNSAIYIDTNYSGALPYFGSIQAGQHYFEFSMPGYDNLGVWLTARDGMKYTITCDPKAELVLFAPNDRVSVASDPTLNAGVATIDVFCKTDGGILSIDRTEDVATIGPTTSYSSTIDPGSHYLKIDLNGYYSLGIWLVFDEKTHYLIQFDPQRITGYLFLGISPADSRLTVDGVAAEVGVSEKGTGHHRVAASRFGYEDKELDVLIREATTSFESIKLEKAAFAVNGLGFSRSVFNPRNAGAAGATKLEFKVSSYGSGHADIKDASGKTVASFDFPDFETRSQSVVWNGRGEDGSPLPDGLYTANLIAKSAEADGTSLATAVTTIDSNLVIRPFGTASAVPGLLYMPDPSPEPALTVATEVFWFSSLASVSDSAFGLCAATSMGGKATIAVQAAAELAGGPVNSGDIAASALINLFGDKTTPFDGAFFIRGSYSSASSPAMPGSLSGIEASLPLEAGFFDLGGLSRGLDLRLALSPGALLDFSSGSASYLGLGRAALWLEGSAFKTGLSCELPFAFTSGFSPQWPAHLAAEGRLMPGLSPFVAAVYATAALSPGSSASFGMGLGLGLFF